MTRAWVLGVVLATAAFAEKDVVADVDALYGEGEFEKAIKKADGGIAKSKNANEVARLHLAKGLSLLAIGKDDKARASFTAALKKDLSVRLDASRVSPDAMALFNRSLAEFPATVTIVFEGGDARIEVDDQALGPAPLTTQVVAGEHEFEATNSDGRTVKVTKKIEAGQKVTVTLALPGTASKPVTDAPVATSKPVTREPEVDSTPPPLPPAEVTTVKPRPNLIGLVPLIGGALVAGGGVFCFFESGARWRGLSSATTSSPLSVEEQKFVVDGGKTFQTLGFVGVGVGAAAMIAGTVLLIAQPGVSKQPTLSAVVTPGGGMVTVQGVLP